MYQNLHCHTKTSDGQLTYSQVLKLCAKYQISVVAFTDHDSLPNRKTVDLLNDYLQTAAKSRRRRLENRGKRVGQAGQVG